MKRLVLLLSTLAVCFLLSGCALLHGWFGGGSGQPVSGGASVSLPLGEGGGPGRH